MVVENICEWQEVDASHKCIVVPQEDVRETVIGCRIAAVKKDETDLGVSLWVAVDGIMIEAGNEGMTISMIVVMGATGPPLADGVSLG